MSTVNQADDIAERVEALLMNLLLLERKHSKKVFVANFRPDMDKVELSVRVRAVVTEQAELDFLENRLVQFMLSRSDEWEACQLMMHEGEIHLCNWDDDQPSITLQELLS